MPTYNANMNRRSFVHTAAAALLLPAGTARALATLSAAQQTDFFFFDERFTEARRVAQAAGQVRSLTPVQSDVTAIWTSCLDAMIRRQPLTLSGVTTESFHFCLATLAREHAHVRSHCRRAGRDLHVWTLATRPGGKGRVS